MRLASTYKMPQGTPLPFKTYYSRPELQANELLVHCRNDNSYSKHVYGVGKGEGNRGYRGLDDIGRDTPRWRAGPEEKPVLCNACGSRWRLRGNLNDYVPKHGIRDASGNIHKLPSKKHAVRITSQQKLRAGKMPKEGEFSISSSESSVTSPVNCMLTQGTEDVVGRVVEIYSPVEKVIAGKLSRLIDFVLEDTSQRQVKCTLWDDHVDELSAYFNSVVADLLILLIQLCQAKIMDNKFPLLYYSLLFYSHYYWVVISYFLVQMDNYCKRKLIEKGGMMVCGGCKSSWQEGVVRYKVIVRVADDTGDALMLIWDRECSDLVGVSASDLSAKYLEGNRGIPPELGCLRGLSMLFKILMKKDQAESYYSAFTVLSICRDEGVLTQHCSNLLGGSERDGISGDGHCVSRDFFSDDEEDCVAVEEVSQCYGLEKVTGLEDFEEGFGLDGADVTLKKSLLKDFDRCGSSKKSKGIVVKEEK
nr:replication protein A 70 kDa DNA-binding subunit B-like [Ipomoea batatas]